MEEKLIAGDFKAAVLVCKEWSNYLLSHEEKRIWRMKYLVEVMGGGLELGTCWCFNGGRCPDPYESDGERVKIDLGAARARLTQVLLDQSEFATIYGEIIGALNKHKQIKMWFGVTWRVEPFVTHLRSGFSNGDTKTTDRVVALLLRLLALQNNLQADSARATLLPVLRINYYSDLHVQFNQVL